MTQSQLLIGSSHRMHNQYANFVKILEVSKRFSTIVL